ncbi:hypothetical protein JXR93_04065 [bacterium]|nr:hypothetical protein [bacterium]
MKKTLFSILFLILSTTLLGEGVILVAARQKVDAYNSTDGTYLGKFFSLKSDDGNELFTPQSILKTSNNKILVAGFGQPVNGQHTRIVSLNMDGTLDKIFFSQTIPTEPLNKPVKMVELDDKSIVVFDSSNYKIFKFTENGELIGELLSTDTTITKSKRNDIMIYKNDSIESLVVFSSDQAKKILEYDLTTGNLLNDLTPTGNTLKNPAYVSRMADGNYMIVDISYNPKKIFMFDKDFFYQKPLIESGIMKAGNSVENGSGVGFIVIDKGRDLPTELSFDDNVELFDANGVYLKSIGTYDDGTLRNVYYIEGITKEW